jgi:hypothetical protein
MIYALKYGSVSGKVRQEIRLAIARQGDLTPYVAQGLISHISGSHPGGDYHCLYCGDQLKPYALARPGKRIPADNWYFQHMGKSKCIGPASTPTSDFKNPAGHGCYVCLGCESDEAGLPTGQSRTCCHTIVNGQTYCHLARRDGCIPGEAVDAGTEDAPAEATDVSGEVAEAGTHEGLVKAADQPAEAPEAGTPAGVAEVADSPGETVDAAIPTEPVAAKRRRTRSVS